ncbi:MAG TPA: TIGR00645 family protein [Rhizomicrobium sp.]|nr:TIGR00645 family protein [Rhizomicrobium sp.]
MKDNPAERAFERFLFASRWLMAPFYVGLVLALVALILVFARDLVDEISKLAALSETDIIVWVLSLVDLSLAANLLVMVIFAGYENFVSKMDIGDHPDRPSWMGKVDFSGMKLKLVASIVAISAIHLLRAFMEVDSIDDRSLRWKVILHLVFVVSGVLLALMDWISEKAEDHD